MLRLREIVLCLALLAGSADAGSAQDRAAAFAVEYTVAVADTARHLFHVSARFSNIRASYLDVALPVWTPGVYEAKHYALNVSRLTAHDAAGTRLRAPRVQPSTWRVATPVGRTVIVEFDYTANDLSWNGAGIRPNYAFFTGTQLFLEPVGYRTTPATVRFVLPVGWKIASALRETADSTVYTAAGYDELVDAPTVLGWFDVAYFSVDGKPHSIVTAPAGAECGSSEPATLAALPKILAVQGAIFGSLPYEKYVFFCIPEESGASLEHGNSYVMNWLDPVSAAHELFHLWNVKRIRPAELWPYDYSRVHPGPSLWFAEGVTSYYEALTAYRAGLERVGEVPSDGMGAETRTPPGDPERLLLDHFGYRISLVESSPERAHNSPSDASMADGMRHGAVPPSYYHSGELLGLLLDLSILHDTRGRRRLDDVMRALYTQFYQQGKGFTPRDLIRTVSAAAGRDYTPFFERYVTGTDVPPYDSIVAFAGYRLRRSSRQLGTLGVLATSTPTGRRVYRTSPPASGAGIRAADVITAIDGVPIDEVLLANRFGQNWIGGHLPGRAGERVTVSLLRGGQRLDVPVTLATTAQLVFRLEPDPAAPAESLTLRRAWLER